MARKGEQVLPRDLRFGSFMRHLQLVGSSFLHHACGLRSQIWAAGILRSHGHGLSVSPILLENLRPKALMRRRRHRAGMRRPGSDHGNAPIYFWHTGSPDGIGNAGHGLFGIGEFWKPRMLTRPKSLPERSRGFFPTVKMATTIVRSRAARY